MNGANFMGHRRCRQSSAAQLRAAGLEVASSGSLDTGRRQHDSSPGNMGPNHDHSATSHLHDQRVSPPHDAHQGAARSPPHLTTLLGQACTVSELASLLLANTTMVNAVHVSAALVRAARLARHMQPQRAQHSTAWSGRDVPSPPGEPQRLLDHCYAMLLGSDGGDGAAGRAAKQRAPLLETANLRELANICWAAVRLRQGPHPLAPHVLRAVLRLAGGAPTSRPYSPSSTPGAAVDVAAADLPDEWEVRGVAHAQPAPPQAGRGRMPYSSDTRVWPNEASEQLTPARLADAEQPASRLQPSPGPRPGLNSGWGRGEPPPSRRAPRPPPATILPALLRRARRTHHGPLHAAAPQAIVNLLWALAHWYPGGGGSRQGPRPHGDAGADAIKAPEELRPALEALSAALLRSLGAASPQDVALCCWALAVLRFRPQACALLPSLLSASAASCPAQTPQGLGALAWGLSRLVPQPRGGGRALAVDVVHALDAAAHASMPLLGRSPSECAMLMAGLTALGHNGAGLWREVQAQVAMAGVSAWPAGPVVQLLGAFAAARRPCPALLLALCGDEIDGSAGRLAGQLGGWGDRELVWLMWALATLRRCSGPAEAPDPPATQALVSAAADAVLPRVQAGLLTPDGVALAAWATATAGLPQSPLLPACARHAAANLHAYRGPQVVMLLTARHHSQLVSDTDPASWHLPIPTQTLDGPWGELWARVTADTARLLPQMRHNHVAQLACMALHGGAANARLLGSAVQLTLGAVANRAKSLRQPGLAHAGALMFASMWPGSLALRAAPWRHLPTAHTAAYLCWAVARAGFWSPPVFELLAVMCSHGGRLPPTSVLRVLWAANRARAYHPRLFGTLATRLAAHAGSLTPRQASSALVQLAAARHYDAAATAALCEQLRAPAETARGACASDALSAAMWAVGALTCGAMVQWRPPIAAIQRAAPAMSPPELVLALWGMAAQQHVLSGGGGYPENKTSTGDATHDHMGAAAQSQQPLSHPRRMLTAQPEAVRAVAALLRALPAAADAALQAPGSGALLGQALAWLSHAASRSLRATLAAELAAWPPSLLPRLQASWLAALVGDRSGSRNPSPGAARPVYLHSQATWCVAIAARQMAGPDQAAEDIRNLLLKEIIALGLTARPADRLQHAPLWRSGDAVAAQERVSTFPVAVRLILLPTALPGPLAVVVAAPCAFARNARSEPLGPLLVTRNLLGAAGWRVGVLDMRVWPRQADPSHRRKLTRALLRNWGVAYVPAGPGSENECDEDDEDVGHE